MSIKVFLSIFVIGIITTLNASLGSGVIDGIKMKKVENQTIFNQEAIKDAIYKYVRINKEYPNNLNELIAQGVLTNDYNNNAFNGNYSIAIDKQNKELKITTSIADNDIRDYFQRTLTNVQRIDKVGDSVSSIYSIPTEISDIAKPLFINSIISTTTTDRIASVSSITATSTTVCTIWGGSVMKPKCRNSVTTYSCQSGYTLSGSTCTKTTYSCPTGSVMDGTNCIVTTYSCPVDYTLQADKQCKLNN